MGCCTSKPAGKKRQELRISNPTSGIALVPTSRAVAGPPEARDEDELDLNTLIRALQMVSGYLQQQDTNVDLVALGGVVNVLHLHTRLATSDLTFFSAKNDPHEAELLHSASRYVTDQGFARLRENWLNSSPDLVLSTALTQTTATSALQQNEVLFHSAGLVVYAAPWDFALCVKIDRITKDRRLRPDDVTDAATYLNRYIQRHQNQPVERAIIQGWASDYNTRISIDAIFEVNAEHRKLFGVVGVAP